MHVAAQLKKQLQQLQLGHMTATCCNLVRLRSSWAENLLDEEK